MDADLDVLLENRAGYSKQKKRKCVLFSDMLLVLSPKERRKFKFLRKVSLAVKFNRLTEGMPYTYQLQLNDTGL